MMSHTAGHRRAFSLVEVLLAIFILGIGVISIAALFPAGIAQQRQSVDDVMGPIVANSALSVIRSKLVEEDFGTMEEFGSSSPRYRVEGDWSWMRPAVIFDDADPDYPLGAIDVFNTRGLAGADEWTGGSVGVDPYGLPFNTVKYPDPANPPVFVITQQERYYPQAPPLNPGAWPKPQYVWECMFRRFQGKMQVAIVVYRVTPAGGESGVYTVAPEPGGEKWPPLPVWVDLVNSTGSEPWRGVAWNAYGFDINEPADDALIPGTSPGDEFDVSNQAHGWQLAGQWLLDQNNNVHRVLSGRETQDEGPVELVRPAPALMSLDFVSGDLGAFSSAAVPGDPFGTGVVTDIWYMPPFDGRETRLTPVYVTVQEL